MLPLKTLDVAIGIALLYLLLTFVASALLELISTARNWRAWMLHDSIANMLKRSRLLNADEVFNSPLVLALSRDNAAKSWIDLLEPFGWRPRVGGTPPSYLPASTFSAAVLEGLMNKSGLSSDLSPDGTLGVLRTALATSPQNPDEQAEPVRSEDALRSVLQTTLALQGPSVQAVRLALEKWFNDTMDRTSGWYKRRTQACLLLIGAVVAFGLNVDTIGIARWLWQGDAARQAVIGAASDYVRTNPVPPTSNSHAGENPQNSPPKDLGTFATQVVNLDRSIVALQYPIGWHATNRGWTWLLQYLFGAMITAIAISMGSSFWFDALQSMVKIRGAGPKPSAR